MLGFFVYLYMKEVWKDIKGFENLYQVSSLGRIKSLGNGNSTDPRTKRVIIMKLNVKKSGYVHIKLCKDNKGHYKSVHRLVADAFIPNIENKREVNHIDGNKLNNSVDNLEWVTSSENQKHAFNLGLQKVVRGSSHKQSKPIIQYNKDGSFVREWESIKQVLREKGYNTVGIIKCCKKEKRYKTAYGYKWEYKES